MKKFIYAASAAALVGLMAPASNAAIVDGINSATLNLDGSDSLSAGSIAVNAAFSEYFGFTLNQISRFSATGTVSGFNTVLFSDILLAVDTVGGNQALFPTLTYVSLPSVLSAGGKGISGGEPVVVPFILFAGDYVLKYVGTNGNRISGFGGDVSIAPIPESSTWAMMVAGIAAVGTALRRRSTLARVSFS